MPISFNIFRKKKEEVKAPSRFPNRGQEIAWMDAKVAHVKATNPKGLSNLFSPASGDYMPQAVHVGTSWKRGSDVEKHYRKIKADHPEAVADAKKTTTGIAGRVSLSRVGDDEDYHNMPMPS